MKNIKGFITNSIAILVGVLTFVFLSQPYFNYIFESFIGNASSDGVSGYAIIGNYFQSEDAKAVVLALACLIVAILAGFLILFAIFNLLTNYGIVKVKKTKVMNIANVVVSILMIIVGAVGLFCAVGIANDTAFNASFGGLHLANGQYQLSWALIVNFVLSFVALSSTFIATIGKEKKSKRKKK